MEAALADSKNLEILAEGGRGKTCLGRYLTVRIIQNPQSATGRRLPIIVDGLSYGGSLLDCIVNTLNQWHAYVNVPIVEAQLSMGNLLVVFDGLSEVREAFLASAELIDIPSFIKRYPNTPFVFTSRSTVATALDQALNDPVTIRLSDLTRDNQRAFLAQHLRYGSKEVDTVISRIGPSLLELSRIPLMLKLISAVYDRTGAVPADGSTLLAQYADQLLRAEATGIVDPAGLKFALSHLVRGTYLRRGGDRGSTIDEAVRLLGSIREELGNYDVKLSAIALVVLFCRAGVLKRTADYVRFFHDSFESYLGARALLADLRNRISNYCRRRTRMNG